MSSKRPTDFSELSNLNTSELDAGSTSNPVTSSPPPPQKFISSQSPWALQKAIAVYRLKYVCAQPCPVFFKSVLSRIPSGKSVYIILLMMGLEQLAYAAASDYLFYPFLEEKLGIRDGYKNLTRSIVTYILGFLMFPVMGWIADAWTGQYRMIHFSLWLLWVGYAILALIYSFCWLDLNHGPLYALPVIFAAISVGHSGFQASAIPFGAEVIKYRTSQELSSYFHCYYWVRNLGFFLFDFFSNINKLEEMNQGIVYSMVAVGCISLALLVNVCFRHLYNASRERINPYKKVLQVLYLAVVIKRPVHRSAFSFTGAKPPSRISLTKEVHGGKFSSEEVEDVKTFLRLLGILLSILLVLIVYSGANQVMPTQLNDMNSTHLTANFSIGPLGECGFGDSFSDFSNGLLVILLIPILNFLLFPFMREYMPNMLKRIGMGSVLLVLAQLSILAVSVSGVEHRERGSDIRQCMFNQTFDATYKYSEVSEYYALLPIVLLSVGEVFVNITSLEFFYAQSPHMMRGMMVGLFFFMWGLSSAIARLMMLTFNSILSTTPMTCDFWYYLLYMFVAVGMFVCYLFVSKRYKNRQRGEADSDQFYRPPPSVSDVVY